MRFVIYTADPEPPHAHIVGDGEARIDIYSMEVITQGGMSDRDVRRAVSVIAENQSLFLGLMSGVFGSKAFMDAQRRGGQSRSPAKIAASRANGAKGGRHENRLRN